MIDQHDHLTLVALDADGYKRTCSYWYLVRASHGPHTAFRTRLGLLLWLAERGLTLTEALPEHGTFSYQMIAGAYRTEAHHSWDRTTALVEFAALSPVIVSRTLSNGDYVVAKITRDEGGIRTVHTLNPNIPRVVFDYWESSAIMDGDRTVAL